MRRDGSVLIHIVDTIPDHLAERVGTLLCRCFHDRPTTEEQEQEHDDRFCSQADAFAYARALDGEEVIGFAAAYRRTITYRCTGRA